MGLGFDGMAHAALADALNTAQAVGQSQRRSPK
jgi:inhibitor of KinA sporulation pathway (predicted exonuclease)